MTDVPRNEQEWQALFLARQKAVLAELDGIAARLAAGGITDAEAQALSDEVFRRSEQESVPLRGPYAAWDARRNRWRWARWGAMAAAIVAFYALVYWFRLR